MRSAPKFDEQRVKRLVFCLRRAHGEQCVDHAALACLAARNVEQPGVRPLRQKQAQNLAQQGAGVWVGYAFSPLFLMMYTA